MVSRCSLSCFVKLTKQCKTVKISYGGRRLCFNSVLLLVLSAIMFILKIEIVGETGPG